MSEYEAKVEAWEHACEMIRERERRGQRVPESWYARERELYRDAAVAETAVRAARQGALWGEGMGRRYV